MRQGGARGHAPEREVLRPDGSVVSVSVTAKPMLNASGTLTGVAFGVTDRQQAARCTAEDQGREMPRMAE